MWTSLLVAATLALHPNSISSSSITPTDAGYAVALRFQALSLVEVLDVDSDHDGRLAEDELDASEAAILAYLGEHYRLQVEDPGPAGEPVLLAWEGLELALAFDSYELDLSSQWVEASLSFTLPTGAVGDLVIECDLFLTTSPDHRDYARFVGPPSVDWLFSTAAPALVLPGAVAAADASAAPSTAPSTGLGTWVRMGLEHILTGYDHLLFVLGLVLAAGSLRRLAVTVTAFTLAHSCTLALAALGFVPAGGLWVELGIALSIVYVGASNLLRGVPRSAAGEALCFGLLHGLGFASLLAYALQAHGGGRLLPLAGFNLGIEAGQLLVALPLGWVLFRLTRPPGGPSQTHGSATPAPGSTLARALSGLVLATGLVVVVLRSLAAFG